MTPKRTPKKAHIPASSLLVDVPEGYLRDYVSGEIVRATAEEIDAVQVFSRRLVEDYGYPLEHVQTRPQHRVRRSPSDSERAYPVDIAVFKSEARTEDSVFLVVECKKKTEKDGVAQLKLYLDMCQAEVGVWFNGSSHKYLRKVYDRKGGRTYQVLPNIPRFGQRIDDIGLYQRKDLVKPSNLRAVFRDIRNHLAGMTVGMTRDESLAQEIINILFCKILDEQETAPNEAVTFRAGVNEPHEEVRERIVTLFERVKTAVYDEVFDASDTIKLDDESLTYVVGELQTYSVMEADRDAIGDAFEVFIGPALRGAEGQFFTPRNVVSMIIEMLDPVPGEKIIDPACGSGGFLITALEHVWAGVAEKAKRLNWSEKQKSRAEIEVATECFRGIDKDGFLAKVCKAYMALVGDGRGGVFCANGLARPGEWPAMCRQRIKLGTFQIVVSNPPFGKKIVVKGEGLLSQYGFGHKWRKNEKGRWSKTEIVHEEHPPQLLFFERCLHLLEDGGRMGIVLPESVLGNPSYEHFMAFVLEHCTLEAVITMPEALFKTSGKGGTHTKVCVLILRKCPAPARYRIFMAEARWCGHDSRGNPTLRREPDGSVKLMDDIPLILARYKSLKEGKRVTQDHLGFWLDAKAIKNRILVPKYYNPEIQTLLKRSASTHQHVSIQTLIDEGVLRVETGTEIGKMAYGTGSIAFVRTSDISNWEVKVDFKHGLSQALYDSLPEKAKVRANDILVVRDGTYLIGTSAMVSEKDLPMVYQSHLLRLRVVDEKKLSPWLLLAVLNSPFVKMQIRAMQFTQDIIDTIGRRFFELILPLPIDRKEQLRVSKEVRQIIEERAALRDKAHELAKRIGVKGEEVQLEQEFEALIESDEFD
ncbi:N-6 DNA methylase [Roseimicrobium sp. ORNL1]|nr:N-6 DNA methylase [Roseimicrobium sp. ORNL1]